MVRQIGHISVDGQHENFLARHADQFASRLVGDQLAMIDDGDPVAQFLGLFEVVRGEHDGHAFTVHLGDQFPQLPPQFHVNASGRLVEHKHGRLVDQRLGDQQAPLHAARERAGIGIAFVGKVHGAQQFLAAAQVLGDAVEPRLVFQNFERREERIEDDLLRNDADRALGVTVVAVDVEAPDFCAARGLAHEPGKNVDQRRLACAIRAEQPEYPTFGDVEGHALERQLSFAVTGGRIALDQITNGDGGVR